RLTKSHMSVYLAERTARCLEDYGIEADTLGFTMDNASNNNTMIQEIQNLLPLHSMSGPVTQVRCLGHVLEYGHHPQQGP
ncbi:hypothetical protein K435DRAFT_688677, partial [Dendrothele bispora CBS 962.96]